MTVFLTICLCLLAYAAFVWLLTASGRRWLGVRQTIGRRCLHKRCFYKPERYPDERPSHWLRGHGGVMRLLLLIPLCTALIGWLWPTPPLPVLRSGNAVLHLMMGAGILRLAWMTFRAERDLRDSPWMRARRLIDRGYRRCVT